MCSYPDLYRGRRGKKLSNSLRLVDNWMQKVGTHETLRLCLMQYARERGAHENGKRGLGQKQAILATGWIR